MAAQVVDRIVEREGREAACRTDDIPLGMSRPEDLETPDGAPGGARSTSSPSATGTRRARCSTSARSVTRSWRSRSSPGHPDLMAEVVIAARREQARSVADVLLRRTRLGLLAAPRLRDSAAARPVAEAMGGELGWSRRRVRAEAEAWPAAAADAGTDLAA